MSGAVVFALFLFLESVLDKIISGIYNDDRGSGLFMALNSHYLVIENDAG